MFPCAYHGNGAGDAKRKLDSLYYTLRGEMTDEDDMSITYLETKSYNIIQDDIIMIDYMSPSMCEEMIRIAENMVVGVVCLR